MEKEAVIIGGSSGIGLNLALELGKKNYNINLISRNIQNLKKAKTFLQKNIKTKVFIKKSDLSKIEETNKLISFFKSTKKKYSFLIYCCGDGYYGNPIKSNSEKNLKILNSNINCFVNIVYYFCNHMLKHGISSYICPIGSLGGFVPNPKLLLYGSSKKFIETFTLTLCEYLNTTNISVSLITPGQTKTKFLKEIRLKNLNNDFLTPHEVAIESIGKILNKKQVIIPGFYNKLRYILFKILPNFLIYKMYKLKK